ncbi:TPM domain-containing protein [Nonlabens antarcticus]|uniref:TPM domain-containing protein n=1 Tax=Nonlabens antarcticus TaxID=392714 RepID=UPI001890F6D8|nr:TPM domain-containing protein [Nonlabens antarcticus]
MESKVEQFLTAAEEQQVVDSIRASEKLTSGEIRVHLESDCEGDVYDRAQEIFHLLKMDNTKQANGVLFYLAIDARKFAVLGDTGIHAHVGDGFWNSIKDVMEVRFRESEFKSGLVAGIQMAGEKLAVHFPWDNDDVNELPDQITTS